MKNITPSILLALAVLAVVLAVYGRYALAAGAFPRLAQRSPSLRPKRRAKAKAAPLPRRLTFAGKCHPMERSDRLPILLITLLYALTAFFQLGNLSSPQSKIDFAGGEVVEIELSETVYLTKLRWFSGLGTGVESGGNNCGYNLEISEDGEHWSTLWRHKDGEGKVTGYFWADAAGYEPDYALKQGYNDLFKWKELEPENPQNVKYLRISGKADPGKEVLQLSELALYSSTGANRDENGLLDISPDGEGIRVTGGEALFDEGDTVPVKSTWHNSTYFDEIYHARTALEHIEGVYPYEITHPPLGKLILGLGIRLFGMTPFGWRFMGALFGVLMVPVLYVFLKNLFGKTPVAACGAALFAAEFMHLTQTRIATIDTYAVFFILCMYFFMYRYLTLPAGTPFKKGALPLFLSGLAWGLGAACKWTVFYAGLGLAVVYFMGFYQKLRDWPKAASAEAPESARAAAVGVAPEAAGIPAEPAVKKGVWIAQTLLFSVLCFILVPFLLYTLSYIPYALALGVPLSLSGLGADLSLLLQNIWGQLTYHGEGSFQGAVIPKDSLAGVMVNNQWYMLTYHQGVTSSHPYSSWWFQWVVDGRPILYYMDNDVAGHTTRFAAFSNPVVCWGGLLAILTCFAKAFRRLWSKLGFLWGFGLFAALVTWRVQHTPNGVFDPELPQETLSRNLLLLVLFLLLYLAVTALIAYVTRDRLDGRDAFITVAFLSQLAPWFFIGRTTFAYHYFPSILFLVFALAALFNTLVERDRAWEKPVYGLTGLAVGLYALFYPVLIGLQIPAWYEALLKWLPSWPI